MKSCFSLLSLSFLIVIGVFGVDTDKVKSVSVIEGDSVTLHTDATEILRENLIMWTFGPDGIAIGKINREARKSYTYDGADEEFRGRLLLNFQTGDLTIENIRTEHGGLYKLTNSSTQTPLKIFKVTVYARLPIPVITTDSSLNSSSSESSSKCVLVCSVVNVTQVTLSWYKGNSLFSSISVSDLNSSLSLHLECLNDSYSCVVNNSFSNQTQHLNITEVCQPCSEHAHYHCCSFTEAVIRLFLSGLVGVAAVAVVFYDIRSRGAEQKRKTQP
ncbi:uncharacterized protein LOC127439006 [Myxocyprinus asiaticus]|uniref:uncharacterized protein LOC127439006 n=1 Tax=Myxocyprinus asiaticus TaxID=70543 RepID=UPI002221A271|nr:uncharacterized protein LOC127439006 [Myxocyprinus asiaticus]